MVCQGNLKWGTANAIGVALVDLRMQSSTPAVVPGAALPRPRLGRVGGYIYIYIYIYISIYSRHPKVCFYNSLCCLLHESY